MSNTKYYLGTIMVSREDTDIEEEVNVLYFTAKDPQKVLDLIAKHSYSDGTNESPVKEDDWWVFADGYMSLAHSYHIIKKSTYEDLQGKIYTDNNHS
tara:strand:- start:121 stop:411 length:291 start_codon:yes stop_codon:yes gene_type:complete